MISDQIGKVRYKILYCMIIIAVFIMGICSQAHASSDPTVKLGRGLTNILTGWGEFFRQPAKLMEENNWMVATFAGVVRGVGATVMREIAGVYDVVTFLVPFPGEYDSIIDPPTVFEEETWVAPTMPKDVEKNRDG